MVDIARYLVDKGPANFNKHMVVRIQANSCYTDKTGNNNIKNRIIKMEIPKTEDDEQQQLVKFIY